MDPAEEIPVILDWCSFSIIIYPHDMVLLYFFGRYQLTINLQIPNPQCQVVA